MSQVTIRRARGGYIIETEEPEPHITIELSKALQLAASFLSGREYAPNQIGEVIILTPVESQEA